MKSYQESRAMLRSRIIVACLAAVFGIVSLSGCAVLFGVAAGAGGVTWVKGKLVKVVNYPFEEVHPAAVRGLKDMNLPIIVDRSDALTGKVESKFSDGTNIWIDTKELTEHSTEVQIRVGVLGDHERSRAIMDEIEANL